MSRLLVVDDDASFPKRVLSLAADKHTVDVTTGAEDALKRLDELVYDAVLTDLNMPPGPNGIELIRRAHERDLDVPFVVLTGHATVETAVNAMREGAFDYLRKSCSDGELLQTIQRAIQHGTMRREVDRLRGEVAQARGLADLPVGNSVRMRQVLALAERVASSEATVLLLGESGTGKELLGRTMHRMSARRDGPFVAFDCSALAPSLLESELFGHEKGAFTGAQRARRGLFREAQGGTLFLDEIGDIAPEIQNKLLRVLQEREIKPVGGDTFVKIDARIISATNKNLKDLVQRGRFREDLYYRLAVVPIELPPLRDRHEDIPLLVAYFLARRRGARPRPRRIAQDVLHRLEAYAWPGNIRELENVLERAAILSDGQEIQMRDLPHLGGTEMAAVFSSTVQPLTLRELNARTEREAILQALEVEKGSAVRAARVLGISRASLYNKLRAHGIKPRALSS